MATIPFTRRTLLSGSTLAGLAAAAGFSPSAQAASARVLRLADSTIGNADPHIPVDFPGSILMFNLYDFLVQAQPGGALAPSVAESWTISPDGTVYTFKIRDGIKFHDGTALTAEDVAFSANRMLTLKRGFSYLFAVVKQVAVTAPMTVAFTLEKPFAPFLASLIRLAVVNRKLVLANKKDGNFGEFGDYGQAFLSRADAGSGPYTIQRHEPQQETVMQKFGAYFAGHAPNAPDLVRSKFGVEQATVRALMPRKELELTRLPLSPEILNALAATPGIVLGQDRVPQLSQLKLNTQKAPTDDVNFRKALALAFDYEALYKLLEVGGTTSGVPARGPIPAGVLGYDPDVAPIKRDLAAAKAALAQSKYATNPPPIDLVWMREVPHEEKFALLFQQNMAELGVTVNIVPTPWAQIQQMATTPQSTAHVSCVYVGVATPDIDSLFWAEYHSSTTGTYINMEWFKDPEVDALLEKGRSLIDRNERDTLYRQIAKKVAAAYPTLILYQSFNVVAMQKYLTAPGLLDPAKSVPVMAGNYQFAKMSMA